MLLDEGEREDLEDLEGVGDKPDIQELIKDALTEHLPFAKGKVAGDVTTQPPPDPALSKCNVDEDQFATITRSIISQLLPAIVHTVARVVDTVVTATLQKADSLPSVSQKLQKQALTAKYDIDRLEQYSRRESIQITGIPEEKDENVVEKVIELGKKIGVDLEERDVSVAHRNGKRRYILCKMTSRTAANKMISARKRLKDIPECASKVYINEDLTPLRSRLLGYAKSLSMVKRVSTKNGRIFCNIADSSNSLVILDTPDDLFNLGVDKVDYKRLGLTSYLYAEA